MTGGEPARKRVCRARPAAVQAKKLFDTPAAPKRQKTLCGKWFINTLAHGLHGRVAAARPPHQVQWKDWPALRAKRGGVAAMDRSKAPEVVEPATKVCLIETLPIEILQQIMRYLLPTGGIFHTFAAEEVTYTDCTHCSNGTVPRYDYPWRVLHHMTPQSAFAHRFMPESPVVERKHLCALSSVSRRLNAVFSSVLYGENQWVVDLATANGETANIGAPPPLAAKFCSDERMTASLSPMMPTGYSIAIPIEDVPDARAPGWPLQPRTAAYVRDLIIAGRLYTPMPPTFATTAERNDALRARLTAVVDLFAPPAASESSPAQKHTLQNVLVYQSEAQHTQCYYIDGIEDTAESARRIRVVPHDQYANDRRGIFPGSESCWEPLRQLCGVTGQVVLKGALTDEDAQTMQDMMKRDACAL